MCEMHAWHFLIKTDTAVQQGMAVEHVYSIFIISMEPQLNNIFCGVFKSNE